MTADLLKRLTTLAEEHIRLQAENAELQHRSVGSY